MYLFTFNFLYNHVSELVAEISFSGKKLTGWSTFPCILAKLLMLAKKL